MPGPDPQLSSPPIQKGRAPLRIETVILLTVLALANCSFAIPPAQAAKYRSLADSYLAAGKYQQASAAFLKASQLYRELGDSNAAEVLRAASKRYETSIRLFAEQPLDEASAKRNFTGAKFEPFYGCLVGVNIEREDTTREPERFNQLIGKKHATFFMYRSFGTAFPADLTRKLKSLRAGLQIAWEPRTLDEMDDYNTVSRFAQAAASSGIPIFLRFASEMNGPWTRYHGNPALYRQKFRTVAKIMHTLAPNVAMVWCPNEIPQEPIADYYPGEEAVDWVGVNFYSVIYNDANRARSGEWRNPADALVYIYGKYSAKHPIMVGEWGATHHSTLDRDPKPQFAVNKIGQFYTALPRVYPRVKAVHWLSMNTMSYASGARKLNNFSLLDNKLVAQKYRDTLLDSYFLESVALDLVPSSSLQIVPLKPGGIYPYGTKVSALVRSYEQQPQVRILVNGKEMVNEREVGDYHFVLSTLGKVELRLTASDSKGRVAGEQKVSIVVR